MESVRLTFRSHFTVVGCFRCGFACDAARSYFVVECTDKIGECTTMGSSDAAAMKKMCRCEPHALN